MGNSGTKAGWLPTPLEEETPQGLRTPHCCRGAQEGAVLTGSTDPLDKGSYKQAELGQKSVHVKWNENIGGWIFCSEPKRTSKAGSFFQICFPASLEAEMLCLLFVFMSVPNHSIVFYSHGAIIKQNCSFGVGVGQHSVNVCIQCQTALGLGTAPSLALQQSLCPSWEVWLSLLSDWMWKTQLHDAYNLTSFSGTQLWGPHKKQLWKWTA